MTSASRSKREDVAPDLGRVPSEPGSSRSAPEADKRLRPSGNDPSRGPLIAHSAKRQRWALAATEIAEWLKHYKGQDAAFRAAMMAFEANDPDALAVERIIKAMWDSPDWSLNSVALACFKAGKAMKAKPRRDSDGSGEASKTGTGLTEGNSADPKGIAPTVSHLTDQEGQNR